MKGSESLLKLQRDENSPAHYTHHDSSEEMLTAMKSIVEDKLLASINKLQFYAIEADEATDSSNKSVLMVFIRYKYYYLCPPLLNMFQFKLSSSKVLNQITIAINE